MSDIINDYWTANPNAIEDDGKIQNNADGPISREGREVERIKQEREEWLQVYLDLRVNKTRDLLDSWLGDETCDHIRIYNYIIECLDKSVDYHNEASEKAQKLKDLLVGTQSEE